PGRPGTNRAAWTMPNAPMPAGKSCCANTRPRPSTRAWTRRCRTSSPAARARCPTCGIDPVTRHHRQSLYPRPWAGAVSCRPIVKEMPMSKDLVARLDDKLRAKRESFDRIPVVDVAPLLDGSGKQEAARQIRWALSNAGFMYVKNHGIAQGFVDEVFDATRRFFDLPIGRKMALHVSNSGVALRGYIEPSGENTDPGKTRDLKECLDIGPERAALEGPFFGPNQWPADFPEFRRLVY